MPLKYHLIQRVNPRNPEAPRKFYAKAIKRSNISLRQLAKEIAQISTVSTVDSIAVIEALLQLIPDHITQGDFVRLGDFGSFYIGLNSEGVEQENEFSADMIKSVKIYFRPGKELKKIVDDTEFEKSAKMF